MSSYDFTETVPTTILNHYVKTEDDKRLNDILGFSKQERELLEVATDVIQARTLSILRRFKNDPERKTSVVRFLVEADVISRLRIRLSSADLSGADLSGADLSNTNLVNADLSGASLVLANLSGASLVFANLSRANLSRANLSGANLSGANLSYTYLLEAQGFTQGQLEQAKICRTFLPESIDIPPDRDCPKPPQSARVRRDRALL